ncbi:MAG: DNA primase [Arenicella sp.]|jgi:DNA primase
MAGRIPQHFIDQLLNRIDIVDLIDGYVPLKKAGANYKANCPFHGEKTPSFTVSPSKQFYHCFGCGVNGSAISFLMDYDHMEFREAIEKLASSAGLAIPEESQTYEKKQTVSEGIDLYKLMDQVSDFYQTQLRQHSDKQEAIDYLKKRGLSGEIAKRFGMGFAPDGWDNLMSQHGATAPEQKALLDTGMLAQNEKQRTYDRFRHRIMFPIEDHRGRTVGFGGRVLGDGEPKYLNSPETPIFHKGSELYGLFSARGGIKDADGVLVVEGYMDVVALAQAGINNAVATLGTATTPMHLQRLFRHTANVTFSFDGDRAGRAAGWKALETCLPLLEDGLQISFLFLPDGEDPDTMVKKVAKEGFEKLIKAATPLPEFLIDTLKQKADIDRLDGRAKLAKLAKTMIQQMPKGILRSLIIERIALLTQANPQDIAGKPQNPPGSQRPQRNPKRAAQSAVSMTPIRRALSLILQYPQFAEEYSILEPISEAEVRGIQMVKDLANACIGNQISTASLLERYRDEAFFATLSQLANHQHHNMESLSDEDAVSLIKANNKKILEAHKEVKLTAATNELASLNNKQKVTTLNAEEAERKNVLSLFIRDSYR